jgi:hypothetical protein
VEIVLRYVDATFFVLLYFLSAHTQNWNGLAIRGGHDMFKRLTLSIVGGLLPLSVAITPVSASTTTTKRAQIVINGGYRTISAYTYVIGGNTYFAAEDIRKALNAFGFTSTWESGNKLLIDVPTPRFFDGGSPLEVGNVDYNGYEKNWINVSGADKLVVPPNQLTKNQVTIGVRECELDLKNGKPVIKFDPGTVNGIKYSWDLMTVNGVIKYDPDYKKNTMYFPLPMINNFLDRINMLQKWDGKTWQIQNGYKAIVWNGRIDLMFYNYTPGIKGYNVWAHLLYHGLYQDSNPTQAYRDLLSQSHAFLPTNLPYMSGPHHQVNDDLILDYGTTAAAPWVMVQPVLQNGKKGFISNPVLLNWNDSQSSSSDSSIPPYIYKKVSLVYKGKDLVDCYEIVKSDLQPYLPVPYLITALQNMGITSTFNDIKESSGGFYDFNWDISKAGVQLPADNNPLGDGNVLISINGIPFWLCDGKSYKDPATGTMMTYISNDGVFETLLEMGVQFDIQNR